MQSVFSSPARPRPPDPRCPSRSHVRRAAQLKTLCIIRQTKQSCRRHRQVEFVRYVVPELQRRGVLHNDYRGTTLRENLGLERPRIGAWREVRH